MTVITKFGDGEIPENAPVEDIISKAHLKQKRRTAALVMARGGKISLGNIVCLPMSISVLKEKRGR